MNDNELDKKIKKALKKEINKPLKYEYSIRNVNLDYKKSNKKFVLPRLAIILWSLIVCCTGVMAVSNVVYEKVWKNPVKVSREIAEKELEEKVEEVKKEVRADETVSFIEEKKAMEIASQILNKLGYNNQEFKSVELIRDYDLNIHYLLRTENEIGKGILINLNPENGELEYFCDNDVLKQNLKCDEISDDEAKEIANKVYEELNIFEKENIYEIVKAEKQIENSGTNTNDMWNISFSRKYNGLVNKDEMFTTIFAVVDGRNVFHIITGKTVSNFESNSIVVSEDEAIEVAKQKEREFSDLEISEVSAKLSIEKMNLFIYYLENNIENNYEEYKIDYVSRVVWVVDVKHNKFENVRESDLQTVKRLYNKKYYIDATTGEIIGGEQSELLQ